MVLRTPVIERQVYCLSIAILDGGIHSVHQPLQTAVGNKITCRLRRSHHVAVPVLYVAHRHIYVAVVQLGSRLVEFNHDLVALADEAEVQVRHVLVRHHGSSHFGVDAGHDRLRAILEQVVADRCACRLARHGVFLVSHLAFVVQM